MQTPIEFELAPIVPLYFTRSSLSEIDNSELETLIAANVSQRKPGSEPSDADYEDIPLRPSQLSSEALSRLVQRVIELVDQVSTIPLKLQNDAVWAIVRGRGQALAYHDHDDPEDPNPNRLSFVYYVKANASNQPLVFPMTLHTHRFDRQFRPKTGDLYVFPSFLPHFTGQENAPTCDRITISGNFVETC